MGNYKPWLVDLKAQPYLACDRFIIDKSAASEGGLVNWLRQLYDLKVLISMGLRSLRKLGPLASNRL